eukprot:scaffold14799_cov54-Cylindrotheca_fusiformis.AAC.1
MTESYFKNNDAHHPVGSLHGYSECDTTCDYLAPTITHNLPVMEPHYLAHQQMVGQESSSSFSLLFTILFNAGSGQTKEGSLSFLPSLFVHGT